MVQYWTVVENHFFSSLNMKKLLDRKKLCEPETKHCKKTAEPVLANTTFLLEENDKDFVDFMEDTLIFTLIVLENYVQIYRWEVTLTF